MARDIDLNDLSKDDLVYLQQRPWLVDEARVAYGVDLKERLANMDNEEEDVRDFSDADGRQAERLTRPASTKSTTSESADEEETDEDSDDYEQWSVAELKDEAKSRDLKVSGSAAELVARLREDDNSEI